MWTRFIGHLCSSRAPPPPHSHCSVEARRSTERAETKRLTAVSLGERTGGTACTIRVPSDASWPKIQMLMWPGNCARKFKFKKKSNNNNKINFFKKRENSSVTCLEWFGFDCVASRGIREKFTNLWLRWRKIRTTQQNTGLYSDDKKQGHFKEKKKNSDISVERLHQLTCPTASEMHLRQWRVQYWLYCIESAKALWNVIRYHVYCSQRDIRSWILNLKRCKMHVLRCGSSYMAAIDRGKVYRWLFMDEPLITAVPEWPGSCGGETLLSPPAPHTPADRRSGCEPWGVKGFSQVKGVEEVDSDTWTTHQSDNGASILLPGHIQWTAM